MLVHEVMTRTVRSIHASDAVDDAIRVLSSNSISSLPVVDGDTVIGIVSEADLLRHLLSQDPRAHLLPVVRRDPAPRVVREVMTERPWTTRSNADVRDVAEVMVRYGWKCVPVVDDEQQLVGVISRSDVIRTLSRTDALVQADLTTAFGAIGRGSWQVSVREGVAHVTGPATRDEQSIATATALAVAGVRDVVCTEAVG